MTRLVPITRQVIGWGFFCEAGVKKFATVFSIDASVTACICHFIIAINLLVTVVTFRRSGGGEIDRVGEAGRFATPSDILIALTREIVLNAVYSLLRKGFAKLMVGALGW